MNTKIYYYLVSGLVLGVTLLFVFHNNFGNGKDTVVSTMETGAVTISGAIVDTGSSISSGTVDTGTQNNSLVYTNTEYGFQLTLPEGWEGYKVFVYDMNHNAWFSGLNTRVVFALPTIDKTRYGIIDPNDNNWIESEYTGQYKFIKGYADMIILNIWGKEGYQKTIYTQNSMGSQSNGLDNIWGSGKEYVYTIDGPNDWPIDIYQQKKNRDNQGKGNYFKEVQRTFKIL